MRYVSLFSGIEAATVAWEPLGWEPVAFAEIEPFPCAVLAHHWPDVPNLGDVCQVNWKEFVKANGAIDVVVGGSPCQSFSIAGGRESLDGESRLMFEYIRAIQDIRPRWLLWENVPGALSVRDNAFGQLVGELADLGYGLAWRVLDAQFFGVAQRRRRVFLVGYLGNGGAAAAVLFNAESVRGNTQTSREKREALTRASNKGAAARGSSAIALQQTNFANGYRNGSGWNDDGSAYTLNTIDRPGVCCMQTDDDVAPCLTSRENSSPCADRSYPVICMADDTTRAAIDSDMCGTLKVGGGHAVNSTGTDVSGTLMARDYKGVGTQYVEEGKVICQSVCI